jgi:hypothetical protein
VLFNSLELFIDQKKAPELAAMKTQGQGQNVNEKHKGMIA